MCRVRDAQEQGQRMGRDSHVLSWSKLRGQDAAGTRSQLPPWYAAVKVAAALAQAQAMLRAPAGQHVFCLTILLTG